MPDRVEIKTIKYDKMIQPIYIYKKENNIRPEKQYIVKRKVQVCATCKVEFKL